MGKQEKLFGAKNLVRPLIPSHVGEWPHPLCGKPTTPAKSDSRLWGQRGRSERHGAQLLWILLPGRGQAGSSPPSREGLRPEQSLGLQPPYHPHQGRITLPWGGGGAPVICGMCSCTPALSLPMPGAALPPAVTTEPPPDIAQRLLGANCHPRRTLVWGQPDVGREDTCRRAIPIPGDLETTRLLSAT